MRNLLATQRGHTYGPSDCVAELKMIMLRIGQDLLGSEEIGSAKSPLIGFVYRALQPILGDATPDGKALRNFAEHHAVDVSALKPLVPFINPDELIAVRHSLARFIKEMEAASRREKRGGRKPPIKPLPHS